MATSVAKRSPSSDAKNSPDELIDRFLHIRQFSEELCHTLAPEDFGLQAIAETSPAKWHIAHTTWFFETFILKAYADDFTPHHPQFEVLFNSYYNGIGAQHPRHQRGLLSRPSVPEVLDYRHAMNEKIVTLLKDPNHPSRDDILIRVELGLHHEQQHQELFLTDLKYNFFQSPLFPNYAETSLATTQSVANPLQWKVFSGDTVNIGHSDINKGFCFDNETPQHPVIVPAFRLADRLITNGEFLDFIQDGAYEDPRWWLSDGWSSVQSNNWKAPLYWIQRDNKWFEFTLHGLQPLDNQRPVVHISAYEADAFARWYGARLPTEFEMEQALNLSTIKGEFNESREFHPLACEEEGELKQLHGYAWQWTSSAYNPYPGFQAPKGAIGEYNGKFMCNQLVLRGSSCATSKHHARATYRNFFYPQDRWQFTGIRLAHSL